MVLQKRNLSKVYYCNYVSKTAIVDSNGYATGESRINYSKPTLMLCNVSPEKGKAQIEVFGNLDSYDKVLLCNKDCKVDENSVLFIDKKPAFDANGTPKYDYIVKRVARSLNGVSIAVSKVKVR